MKLQTNLVFREDYLPPRCRKTRTRTQEFPFEFDLTETSGEQAPLVLVVKQNNYRFFSNQLWVNCSDHNKKNIPAAQAAEYVLERYGMLTSTLTKNEVKDKFLKLMEKYLAIDDMLYAATEEPYLTLSFFGLSYSHGGAALILREGWHRSAYEQAWTWNLADFDRAQEEATQLARKNHGYKGAGPISCDSDFILHRPELLRFRKPGTEASYMCNVQLTLPDPVKAFSHIEAEDLVKARLESLGFDIKNNRVEVSACLKKEG